MINTYLVKTLFVLWFFYTNLVFSANYLDREQYGNKTANLASIQAILAGLSKNGVPVKVPDFMGISHLEVRNFLSDLRAWQKINDTWQDFIRNQERKAELTDEGKASLRQIRTLIDDSFKKEFAVTDKDRNGELHSFLNQALDNNFKLMVRSTGKEDSKEMANAGGNESIANVEPNIKEVSAAMSRVLQSYFSEKSFNQRIAAGESEQTLFGDPFLPVLLQVMIREKPKHIPTSGVAFSREILGNTPGVVSIDATFGHGEAVVNSLYPTDTFYIGPSNIIHPIIRIKHTRLKPKEGESGLMPINNPTEMQKQSSLSPDQINYIVQTARALEEDRDEAVDMEFVALDDQIYVVQVRPIVEAQNKPSYLSEDFVKTIPINDQVVMSPIVSGGGELKRVTSDDQVIITDKIGQALDIYLAKKKEEQERVLLIISGENAPQTSHEATTFRSNNKPVMYVREIDKAKAILSSDQYRLVDVQRGRLFLSQSFEDSFIKAGWLKHPIEEMVSIHPQFLGKDIPVFGYNYPEFMRFSINDLLDIARHSQDYETAKKAIYSLNAQIVNRIESEEQRQKELIEQKAQTNPQLISQLKSIHRHIKYAARETLSALHSFFNKKGEKSDQDALLRLYPINFLSALISQVPQDKLVVSPYSIGYLIKVERQEAGFIKALELHGQESRAWVVQYARVGSYGLTDQVTNAWGDFLRDFNEVEIEDQRDFSLMMQSLAKFNILPLWLNTVFYHAYQKNNDAKLLTKTLIIGFNKESEFINKIAELLDQLNQFPLNQLGNPKKFKEISDNFREQILSQIDEGFLFNIANGNILTKSIGVSFLNQLVAIFDTGIKNLTGSTEYPSSTKKAEAFEVVLRDYLALLRNFASHLLKPIDIKDLLHKEEPKDDIKGYLDRIEQLLTDSIERVNNQFESFSDKAADIELLPSRGFNVSAAKLGSKAMWSRSIGDSPTLEDLFSLIHQNLLVILARTAILEEQDKLPANTLLKQVQNEVNNLKVKIEQGESSPALLGIDINNQSVTYYYNLPLRHHSSTFQIHYHFKDRSTTLNFQFMGDARGRWAINKNAVNWLAKVYNLTLAEPIKLDERRGLLDFHYKLPQTLLSGWMDDDSFPINKVNRLFAHLGWLARLTLIGGGEQPIKVVSGLMDVIKRVTEVSGGEDFPEDVLLHAIIDTIEHDKKIDFIPIVILLSGNPDFSTSPLSETVLNKLINVFLNGDIELAYKAFTEMGKYRKGFAEETLESSLWRKRSASAERDTIKLLCDLMLSGKFTDPIELEGELYRGPLPHSLLATFLNKLEDNSESLAVLIAAIKKGLDKDSSISIKTAVARLLKDHTPTKAPSFIKAVSEIKARLKEILAEKPLDRSLQLASEWALDAIKRSYK